MEKKVSAEKAIREIHDDRPLSDNGPCYAAKDMAAYLVEHGIPRSGGGLFRGTGEKVVCW